MKQEEGKTHGYTWELFKECMELEFIPNNSDNILRCKFRDLVNVMNDNLSQNVRAYSELMLEIHHMHELDWVCHFVMGLLTWVKPKLEENWPTPLFEAITKWKVFKMWDGVKSLSSRRRTNSLTRRHAMEGNGIKGKTLQKGKCPNNFKPWVSNPKGISSRKEFL
jgi:hypothetical protein